MQLNGFSGVRGLIVAKSAKMENAVEQGAVPRRTYATECQKKKKVATRIRAVSFIPSQCVTHCYSKPYNKH